MMIMLLITVYFNKLHHHHACVVQQYMLFCSAMRMFYILKSELEVHYKQDCFISQMQSYDGFSKTEQTFYFYLIALYLDMQGHRYVPVALFYRFLLESQIYFCNKKAKILEKPRIFDDLMSFCHCMSHLDA